MEKRDVICVAATHEFARYQFEQASINRIVAQSGIAKGSFYQYFEDKKDLFLYLVQMAAEAKAEYVSPVMVNPEDQDLFSLLRDMYLAGIQFAAEHPEYAEISKKIMENKTAPLYMELMADNLAAACEQFQALLKKAVARGEVRADIDINMFAYLIVSMNTLVVEYYLDHVTQEYDEGMLETIDKFLSFLKRGIGTVSTKPAF